MNGKKECSECHRLLRTRCFVFNPIKKILICHQCNKKIGTNKWFVPKNQRKNYNINKYNMSEEEKKVLHNQLMSFGMSSDESWKKINNDLVYLRNLKWLRNKEYWEIKKKNKELMEENTRKKKLFLEGLKNG